MLIDDFTDPNRQSRLGTVWRGVSDKVMGGISEPKVTHIALPDRNCLRLSGEVRLENNGGFIQTLLDLSTDDKGFDASMLTGVRLVVKGNNEVYGVHLRTPDNVKSWQSYRAQFTATPEWAEIKLPFSEFSPHRLEAPLDLKRLKRIGLVAIGRAFQADLWISEVGFY